MRILNRQQFLRCPRGTVFFDYRSLGINGALSVKTDNSAPDDVDFYRLDVDVGGVAEASASQSCSDSNGAMDLLDRAEKGEHVSLHFDAASRDGMFDDDAMFAVLDDDDVARLIHMLVTRKDGGP